MNEVKEKLEELYEKAVARGDLDFALEVVRELRKTVENKNDI